MAKFRVDGLRNAATKKVHEIDEQAWGIHGPAQTQWVEKWVYPTLVISTVLLTLLVISSFGGFSSELVETSVPASAVVQPTPPLTHAVAPVPAPVQPVQPTSPSVVTPPVPASIQQEQPVQPQIIVVQPPASQPVTIPQPLEVEVNLPLSSDCSTYTGRERRRCQIWVERR